MKINARLVPLKVHNFLFQGCLVPILPFIIIVALQLGIPVSVQGTVAAVSLLITVLGKPIIAGLADTYPSYRKAIFLLTLSFMVGCYSSIWFIPPLRDTPVLKGQLVRAVEPAEVSSHPAGSDITEEDADSASQLFLHVQHEASCYVAVGWDCIESCSEMDSCIPNNSSFAGIKAKEVDNKRFLLEPATVSESFSIKDINQTSESKLQNHSIPVTGNFYQLEGINITSNHISQNISLVCANAEWSGDSCKKPWDHWEFWMYVLFLNIAQITFNTGNSITDAIAVDSIGENGNYGVQRAWGSLGWGIVGTFSGLIVDLWSGSSIIKNYTPAFLICFILGSFDILVCASALKVPKIGEDDSNVLKLLGPLLRNPKFFISCCFILFNGCFDGIVTNFLFILQDEMAHRTDEVTYLTFLQGFSLLIQCATEAPFMFAYGWFLKKLGVQKILSFVFFVYMLRMWGLAIVGYYGPVWSTLVVEILNGPCFGLGYTVTVAYAATISPPGTSTTVQSILNICFDNLGYALANLAGGILIDVLGAPGMFVVAGFTAATVFSLHFLWIRLFPEGPIAGVRSPTEQSKDTVTEEQTALNENPNDINFSNNCLGNAEAGKEGAIS